MSVNDRYWPFPTLWTSCLLARGHTAGNDRSKPYLDVSERLCRVEYQPIVVIGDQNMCLQSNSIDVAPNLMS